ncbi:MAG: hypothetical protein ABJN26_06090 [Stappiaceae bacterium]
MTKFMRLNNGTARFLLLTAMTLAFTQGHASAALCSLSSDREIVDAVIERYVQLGASQRAYIAEGRCPPGSGHLAQPPCVNYYPYSSVEDFREKNPDCCSILTDIPGDEAHTYRPNIRGEKNPKMYLVNVQFNAWSKRSNGTIYSYKKENNITIDCNGNFPDTDVK